MATLKQVHNADGMAARYSYAAYHDDELLAIDLIGAESEVKALAATLIQHKWVKLSGTWGRKRVCGETEIDVLRTTLEDRPALYCYHVMPAPSENALMLAVYGWEEVIAPANALIGALANWTVWPTLPEWGEPLYRLGREAGLVKALDHKGLDYAFAVSTQGWDGLIDRAIKAGGLTFPEHG
jgi:hypothetical protein